MHPIMYNERAEIDERWLADYVAFGIGQMQMLLAKYQAFYRHIEQRETVS